MSRVPVERRELLENYHPGHSTVKALLDPRNLEKLTLRLRCTYLHSITEDAVTELQLELHVQSLQPVLLTLAPRRLSASLPAAMRALTRPFGFQRFSERGLSFASAHSVPRCEKCVYGSAGGRLVRCRALHATMSPPQAPIVNNSDTRRTKSM